MCWSAWQRLSLASAVGVTSLALNRTILWSEYWASALSWFAGDCIGLLALAPFLLIHVFPRVRGRFLGTPTRVRCRRTRVWIYAAPLLAPN